MSLFSRTAVSSHKQESRRDALPCEVLDISMPR